MVCWFGVGDGFVLVKAIYIAGRGGRSGGGGQRPGCVESFPVEILGAKGRAPLVWIPLSRCWLSLCPPGLRLLRLVGANPMDRSPGRKGVRPGSYVHYVARRPLRPCARARVLVTGARVVTPRRKDKRRVSVAVACAADGDDGGGNRRFGLRYTAHACSCRRSARRCYRPVTCRDGLLR